LKVLAQHLLEGTEGNHETPQSGKSMSQPILKVGTSPPKYKSDVVSLDPRYFVSIGVIQFIKKRSNFSKSDIVLAVLF
jgi:hypothetical protein